MLIEKGYSIVSDEALALVNSSVVGFMVNLFRLAMDPNDLVSLAAFNRYMERPFRQTLTEGEKILLTKILSQTPVEAIESVIGFFSLGIQSGDVSYIQAFYQVLYRFSNENVPDLRMFIDWWNDNGGKQSLYLPSGQNSIAVMTVHKAKGLEFPCVVLPYADWSLSPKSGGGSPTVLWAGCADPRFSEFDPFPINYKKIGAVSHFSDDYYRETVYSHVDNINLLYVALTRAERELYISFADSASRKDNVGWLINSAIASIEGVEKIESDPARYVYGAKTTAAAGEGGVHVCDTVFDKLVSRDSGQHVRTSWRSERYFADENIPVDPRNKGVMMHLLFERIKSADDIPRVIREMVDSGNILPGDAVRLEKNAAEALSDPLVAGWFSSTWSVYNERSVISPDSHSVSRPDRVLVKDNEAVVIDYKFGLADRAVYKRQVKDYMDLLKGMGYGDVKGYIWYVELGRVVAV